MVDDEVAGLIARLEPPEFESNDQWARWPPLHVPFAHDRPAGPPRDILTGFLSSDERHAYGRPVGVTLGPDRSLLIADDVGDVIWRVAGA